MEAPVVQSLAGAKNILAIRLDSLGDVLMTGPALRCLAGQGNQVTLLTSSSGAAGARLMPHLINDVIIAQVPWMKHPRPASREDLASLRSVIEKRAFDAAIIFTVYSQSPLPAAMLCYEAGIPLRAAFSRENPYQLLTHWTPEEEREKAERHEVLRQLALVRHCGFETPAAPKLECRIPAGHVTGHNGRYVVIHPGATAPSRQYAMERFQMICRSCVEKGFEVLVTGSHAEQELCTAVAGSVGKSLAGMLSIEDLAGLIAGSSGVITNNTGPAHIAAALNVPLVVLYALTNPQHTPWSDRSAVLSRDVPCRWCLKSRCPMGTNACLDVEPEEVLEAIERLWSAALQSC